MCGGGMAHSVWRIFGLQKHSWMLFSGLGNMLFVDFLNTGNGHMFMSLAGKDIAVQFMGDTPPIQIVLEHIGRGLCNHDPPNLVPCLLYTSDAADDLMSVDLGGRRIIKKAYALISFDFS